MEENRTRKKPTEYEKALREYHRKEDRLRTVTNSSPTSRRPGVSFVYILMNLKTKSRILFIVTKILAFITIILEITYCINALLSPETHFLLYLLRFIGMLITSQLILFLSDIFNENYFYEHLLKATSEKKLLAKGFEYMITSLYLEFNIESIEIDGEKVSYSEDKEKLKKLLEQNDKVTVFCHLISQGRWVFWSISNKEKRGSREQLISFELPSKKLLEKIQKKEKPYIVHEINVLYIRNKYAIYPYFVFIPQNVTSDPDCCKLLEQIIKDGDPMTLAHAILSEDVPLFSRNRLSKNTQSNYVVNRESYTVPFEGTWNPLVFSGNGCGLACFQEDGCKCCITPDYQKDSSDSHTRALKQEQTHEVHFDDKTKNHLLDRIEIIDQKLKDGFLFRNIRTSKWENGYKDQILNALRSPYPLDAETAEMFEKVIEELEENLYDAKREAEDLDRECTAKALKDMLIMDGIQTNTLSKNEECKGEKNDFCN